MGKPKDENLGPLQVAAECLASALHDHNIGRDIRGWEEVREAFALVKEALGANVAADV